MSPIKVTKAKPRGRSLTTPAEIRAAARKARERESVATKIVSAHHDPDLDAVVVRLSTGAMLSVPRRSIPGFATANAGALNDLALNPGSESLWSDTVDDGVLLEQLFAIALGRDIDLIADVTSAAHRQDDVIVTMTRQGGKNRRERNGAA